MSAAVEANWRKYAATVLQREFPPSSRAPALSNACPLICAPPFPQTPHGMSRIMRHLSGERGHPSSASRPSAGRMTEVRRPLFAMPCGSAFPERPLLFFLLAGTPCGWGRLAVGGRPLAPREPGNRLGSELVRRRDPLPTRAEGGDGASQMRAG